MVRTRRGGLHDYGDYEAEVRARGEAMCHTKCERVTEFVEIGDACGFGATVVHSHEGQVHVQRARGVVYANNSRRLIGQCTRVVSPIESISCSSYVSTRAV